MEEGDANLVVVIAIDVVGIGRYHHGKKSGGMERRWCVMCMDIVHELFTLLSDFKTITYGPSSTTKTLTCPTSDLYPQYSKSPLP